jgi:hypothetical protein
MIKKGANILRSEIHGLTFISSILNMEELPQLWKESITLPNYKKSNETDFINYGGISLLPTTQKFIPYFSLKLMSIRRWNY